MKLTSSGVVFLGRPPPRRTRRGADLRAGAVVVRRRDAASPGDPRAVARHRQTGVGRPADAAQTTGAVSCRPSIVFCLAVFSISDAWLNQGLQASGSQSNLTRLVFHRKVIRLITGRRPAPRRRSTTPLRRRRRRSATPLRRCRRRRRPPPPTAPRPAPRRRRTSRCRRRRRRPPPTRRRLRDPTPSARRRRRPRPTSRRRRRPPPPPLTNPFTNRSVAYEYRFRF